MTKYKAKGILRGVELGTAKNGNVWAKLTIEKADGKKKIVSTWEPEDAKRANGKEVEVIYVKKGNYNNAEKGGIKVIGAGEAPIEDEEVVNDEPVEEDEPIEEPEETPAEKVKNEIKAKRPVAAQPQPTDWNAKDQRSMRAMSLAYSKDLVVAGKLELAKMKATAQTMYEFIWEGYPIEDDSKMVEDDKK